MSEGDSAYRARDARLAMARYAQAAATEPGNYEAHWKVALCATDLGEFMADAKAREDLFSRARAHSRTAIRLDPTDPEGHFQLARALGRAALSAGIRERVRLAKEIRESALAALELDPRHSGALHVLGSWNAEVMRLSGFERMFARAFLGGSILGEASWLKAVGYLEQAVEVDPERMVHRLDLGVVYADIGKTDAARALFEWIERAPVADYNDPQYKQVAARALLRLK